MLQVGLNIKEIRSKKGILQKEVAAAAGLHPANYNKIEKGEREPSVEALAKVAKLFDMTIDQVVYYEGDIPSEVTIEDKSVLERMKMIDQLGNDDKQAIFQLHGGQYAYQKQVQRLLSGTAFSVKQKPQAAKPRNSIIFIYSLGLEGHNNPLLYW